MAPGMMTSDRAGYRESGSGILEFSPAKAGLDVTPANLDFSHRKHAPFVGSFVFERTLVVNVLQRIMPIVRYYFLLPVKCHLS